MAEPEIAIKNSRQKYTAEERKRYVEQWQASSLTRSEFCRQKGLSLKTFCYWAKHIKPKPSAKPTLSFLPLTATRATRVKEDLLVEIHLSNGIHCYFNHNVDIQKLVQVVEGLSHVTHD